jgi:single-strand DNA-binding protein
MTQERWEQDGQNRSKVVVTASAVQLLGGAPDSGSGSGQSHSQTPPLGDGFGDDIPF